MSGIFVQNIFQEYFKKKHLKKLVESGQLCTLAPFGLHQKMVQTCKSDCSSCHVLKMLFINKKCCSDDHNIRNRYCLIFWFNEEFPDHQRQENPMIVIRIFSIPFANETFCTWLPGLLYSTFNALYFLNDGNGPNDQPYTYYVLYWKKPAEAVTTTILEVCTSTFLLNYAILLIIRRFVMCSGFFYLFKFRNFCGIHPSKGRSED